MRQAHFNIYTIDELEGAAKQKALEAVAAVRHENMTEFYIDEFLESARAFAGHFFFKVDDYSIDFFEYSFIKLQDDFYSSMTNKEKNELVAEVNRKYISESQGACTLTGVYTDAYFYDYFVEKRGTSYNTFHKDIPQAVKYALDHFIQHQRDSLLNDEDTLAEAREGEYEFLEDGSIYYEQRREA